MIQTMSIAAVRWVRGSGVQRFRGSGFKVQMTEFRRQMMDLGTGKSNPPSSDRTGLRRGKHAEVGRFLIAECGIGESNGRNLK